MRTADVAERTGLTRPTAYRLLAALAHVGYLDRDVSTGLWHLGPELYLLGGMAAHRFEVSPSTRQAIARLAEATAESAFFSVRRGDQVLCLLRQEGRFPIRSFVLREGSRFPLGVSSGGLVLLAYMADAEIDRYLATADLTRAWGPTHAPERIREHIDEVRARGYVVNPGMIVEGSYGMAAAIFSESGRAEAAVCLTGVESRFSAARQPELGALLLEVAHELSTRSAVASR